MRTTLVSLFVLCCLPAIAGAAPTPAQLATRLHVPPGFTVTLFAQGVTNAREMAWGDRGTLFVGSNDAGKVYALRDDDHDGRADGVHVIASGLRDPLGIAFRNGALYVSAIDRILRYDGIEAKSSMRRRQRSLSSTIFHPKTTTADAIWRSVRTASCTCRSVRLAMSATGPATRSSRA